VEKGKSLQFFDMRLASRMSSSLTATKVPPLSMTICRIVRINFCRIAAQNRVGDSADAGRCDTAELFRYPHDSAHHRRTIFLLPAYQFRQPVNAVAGQQFLRAFECRNTPIALETACT